MMVISMSFHVYIYVLFVRYPFCHPSPESNAPALRPRRPWPRRRPARWGRWPCSSGRRSARVEPEGTSVQTNVVPLRWWRTSAGGLEELKFLPSLKGGKKECEGVRGDSLKRHGTFFPSRGASEEGVCVCVRVGCDVPAGRVFFLACMSPSVLLRRCQSIL